MTSVLEEVKHSRGDIADGIADDIADDIAASFLDSTATAVLMTFTQWCWMAVAQLGSWWTSRDNSDTPRSPVVGGKWWEKSGGGGEW
jgi:hypothetical protein